MTDPITQDPAETTNDAPYGYKADGTSYKRRPRSPEASAQAVATRRAKTPSGNGTGPWIARIETIADELDVKANELEALVPILRRAAEQIRG